MEEGRVLSAAEAAEYGEFQRTKRETEISFTLRKLVIEAFCRADKADLKKAGETAGRLRAAALLVTPVNVVRAKKLFTGDPPFPVYCAVGGTGESLVSVKKTETKKAVRQGAGEIRLTPCYSALLGGNFNYVKREIKQIRRATKKQTLVVGLDDRNLSAEEIALGVKAACAARADGVCVRGETQTVLEAVQLCEGKLFIEAEGVENAEQLRLLLKAGAARACTQNGERIAGELYADLSRRGEKKEDIIL